VSVDAVMRRKTRPKKRKPKPVKQHWWTRVDDQQRRRLIHGGGIALLGIALVGTVVIGMSSLERHVLGNVADSAAPTIAFVDLPGQLVGLADRNLHDSLAEILARRSWLDTRTCREMSDRLENVGWVAKVNHVRRTSDGRFEVSGQYRVPFAMVQHEAEFFLVDGRGVRLPGTYLYDPQWRLVQGKAAPPPLPGSQWEGDDLQAGLNVLRVLQSETFANQLTAVLVGNYDGRVDSKESHLELATDRAGGRIHWGSAPGRELAENSVEQKLAILRENYRRTGRADAGHPVIDISTSPDRFTIPG